MLISAGFDAHAYDDMSHLRLRETDYRWVTEQIRGVAERHAGGRVVSVLEGGYELEADPGTSETFHDVKVGIRYFF